MKYLEFKTQYQNLPFILSRETVHGKKDKQVILNQINRWQKKGLLVTVRRGMYLLNKHDRKINPNPCFLANQIYSPSYISLEYALYFYELIPEKVYDITSVTTKKTMRFENQEGSFVYQHVKPEFFRGFKSLHDDHGLSFFMAEPEKALIDFFYLNLDQFRGLQKDIFEKSYRFQNVDILNAKKLLNWGRLLRHERLMCIIELFCDFLKQETSHD